MEFVHHRRSAYFKKGTKKGKEIPPDGNPVKSENGLGNKWPTSSLRAVPLSLHELIRKGFTGIFDKYVLVRY